MAAQRKPLIDKRTVALARARFRAWWEGESFDEAAFAASFEAPASDAGLEGELFDAPAPEPAPRLDALAILWGAGRVRPGDDAADAAVPARFGAPDDGLIAISGAGLAAPIIAFAGAFKSKMDVFDWREETIEHLRYGLGKAKLAKRTNVVRIDLEAHVFQREIYDGVWSLDDFAYVSYTPHLAQQLIKMLKPGACAVVECYVGLRTSEFATAFASAFAEPQIRAHGDMLQFFTDVGLKLESDEDLTEDFLALAREGFKRLGAALTDAANLDVHAARELAWEAEAWRTRLKLLTQRRLERRRFVLRKPNSGAAQTDAPLALEQALPVEGEAAPPAAEELTIKSNDVDGLPPLPPVGEPGEDIAMKILAQALADSKENN